ncbi:PREDICTED: uncharacterized protein LOC109124873 [Camelina sativa]|uniref:Uncharacterized protein LOC109124873 n=1 Tax=Camelina sativa TaxID=90675 RepID=A0ABM0T888_CAMSA|nr:PREDICTED: uncharacterized protein LOC109124873 [Camelina sativa]
MGGLVTPILQAKGVELGEFDHDIARLDPVYLKKTTYLDGQTEKGFYAYYGYIFKSMQKQRLLLPQKDVTSLYIKYGICCQIKDDFLYSSKHDGPVIPITTSWKGRNPTEDTSQAASPSPVYGSARYDFQPFEEATTNKSLRAAHTHIDLLQCLVRWQGKNIKKLVKGGKGLHIRLKHVEAKLDITSTSRPNPEVEVNPRGEQADEVEDELERHSFHGEASTALGFYDPPRASAYERRQRRKRRAEKSPTPCTSNSSYSLDSSMN